MPIRTPEELGSASHGQRAVAEGFGADAVGYDRARPRYPDAMVARVLASSPDGPVLDVGCGTGIATRQFEAAGRPVLGVDVDERMTAVAAAAGSTVEVAGFEDWDPAGRDFAVLIAGQTWHWIDPVAGAAQAARVLRPGGRIAVFWNVFRPDPELGAAFAAVYRRVAPPLPFTPWNTATPAGHAALADPAEAGLVGDGRFRDVERWSFDWDHRYSRADWLDQVPTHGGHRGLPDPVLAELLAGIKEAVDAVGGAFTMHYTTVVVTAVRRDDQDRPLDRGLIIGAAQQ